MPATRELVEDFYRACAAHDNVRLDSLLHDDVEWMMTGPVDVLPYCGRHKGKAAAMDKIRRGREVIEVKSFEFDEVLTVGDHAAILFWLVGVEPHTGRAIKYRCAQFLRFRDGKLISLRVVRDTLTFIEQMVGHKLELGRPAQEQAA